jgi:hypothetical protein
MATLERRIVEAILRELRLAGIEGVVDRVYEDRGMTIAATDLPAIDVMALDDELDVLDIGDLQMMHRASVDVAVLAREQAGESPSAQADPILADVHRAVMRSTALAALVRAIVPGPVRSQRSSTGDGTLLRKSITYTVDFVTAVDDLEAAP